MKADIRPMERSSSRATGRVEGAAALWGYILAALGIIVAVVSVWRR